MPAFLSHSSKDKDFVSQVAASMNPLEYEFDESTFEYILNVKAIRNALSRSDLAVFFLSKNSISSTFVAEEQRQALELLGKGQLKRLIVISLDETSYSSLPDWLREINVVQRISNAKVCARRIQALLVEIGVSDEPEMLYLGRDNDESILRKALRQPESQTPVALHIVGFHGIGRRTFIKNTLTKLFPRFYSGFVLETVNNNQGIEDIYRAIYRLTKVSSNIDQLEDFERFAKDDETSQIASITHMIRGMCNLGELLIVFDEGNGIFDDSGELFPHWRKIVDDLADVKRPALAFIQTRMQPFRLRQKGLLSFHQKLDAIQYDDTKEIIMFSLKQKEVAYTEQDIDDLATLSGGHPYNIRFAVGLAANYGVEPFLKDPGQFIAWRDKRGEDFIREIAFDELEEDIVAYLIDYKYLATDAIVDLVDGGVEQTIESLRNLQDFCCVEFRDGMFHLAAPIRESARRDDRFTRSDDWRRSAANTISEHISLYEPEDEIPLNLLETATMASIRSDDSPDYVRALVLPSHLLIVAREHYDNKRRELCISLAKQAYDLKVNMTADAQIEALRLWALSAARIKDAKEYAQAMKLLKSKGSKTAVRVAAFVSGFKARLDNRDDEAEAHFIEAWNLSPTNASINRELAKIYCGQKNYVEAEQYARQAYSVAPTNPYLLDIMLEVLLGKQATGLDVSINEIRDVQAALKVHGNEPGLSFFPVREAQKYLNNREYSMAISLANQAIEMTPDLIAPYFIKIEAQTRSGMPLTHAEKTIKDLRGIIESIGTSEGERARLDEAEIQINIERKQYVVAKKSIDESYQMPERIRMRLYQGLAKAVSFNSSSATPEIVNWAKSYRS